MIKAVMSVAKQHGDRYPRIYVTGSHDAKKNPLDIGKKIAYLRAAFPGIEFKPIKNVIAAIQEVSLENVKHPVLVAGSDRAPGYERTLQKGIEGGHTHFEDYKVVPLQRDPDADDVTGASATKARELAVAGDIEGFKQIAPSKLSDEQKELLYNAVREGMGIK